MNIPEISTVSSTKINLLEIFDNDDDWDESNVTIHQPVNPEYYYRQDKSGRVTKYKRL